MIGHKKCVLYLYRKKSSMPDYETMKLMYYCDIHEMFTMKIRQKTWDYVRSASYIGMITNQSTIYTVNIFYKFQLTNSTFDLWKLTTHGFKKFKLIIYYFLQVQIDWSTHSYYWPINRVYKSGLTTEWILQVRNLSAITFTKSQLTSQYLQQMRTIQSKVTANQHSFITNQSTDPHMIQLTNQHTRKLCCSKALKQAHTKKKT